MVVLVVFPLLARPAPVSTKYHTIAGILDASVTLCRQPLPAARAQPFLTALRLLAEHPIFVATSGVIPTPGVACLVRQKGLQAGVVISASHNPYHDNGVKLFSNVGMKFPDSVEEVLEQDIFQHRSEAPPKNPPRLVADESLDAEYLKFLRSRVIPGAKLSTFRIVLDCANDPP